MKLRKFFMHLAPAVLLMGFSTFGVAATANGSFGFALLGCCSLNGGPTGQGNLMTASTLSFAPGANNFFIITNDALTFGNPNDFQGLSNSFGTLAPNGLNLTIPFNPMAAQFGPGNIYNFTALSEVMTVSATTGSISFYFLGTFTDSTSAFDPAAAALTLQFTQSAPNSSISGSGTLSTPPEPLSSVPEPGTMSLLGSALIGAGVIGRKRLARR